MRHDDEKEVRSYLPEDLYVIETGNGQMVLIIVEGEYGEIDVALAPLKNEIQ